MLYSSYEYGTGCSETTAQKIQAPGNHPKERTQHALNYFQPIS